MEDTVWLNPELNRPLYFYEIFKRKMEYNIEYEF